MKNFDVYLRRAIRKEPVDWSEHYVDYELLKGKLSSFQQRRKALGKLLQGDAQLTYEDLNLAMATAEESSALEDGDYFQYVNADEQTGKNGCGARHAFLPSVFVSHCDSLISHSNTIDNKDIVDVEKALFRLSVSERTEFCQLLEGQIAKAATFYSTQLVGLAQLVSEMTTETSKEVGNEILEVYCFVVVNLITLRQILIRYDAYCRTYDGAPLSEWYLQKRQWDGALDGEDYLQALFHLDALNHVEGSYTVKADKMGDSTESLTEFASQYQQFRDLMNKTFDSVERAAGGHIVFRDRFVVSIIDDVLVSYVLLCRPLLIILHLPLLLTRTSLLFGITFWSDPKEMMVCPWNPTFFA